ncbi:MAG: NeuD/PglB/VioB family sugar acetyltransferase [Terracoccus sp.]
MATYDGRVPLTETSRPLVLVAASGLARETALAARSAGHQVLGALDDDSSLANREISAGLTVIGPIEAASSYARAMFVVCAGKGAVRAAIVARLAELGIGQDRYATVVHPSVSPPPDPVPGLGPGSVLLAGVVLTADVSVGAHVVCMPSVVLTHDCRLEDYATLCAGVVLGGSVTVGREAYVGMSSSVREGRTIGAGSVVGMGSVVLADVPARETWVGAPARPLRV